MNLRKLTLFIACIAIILGVILSCDNSVIPLNELKEDTSSSNSGGGSGGGTSVTTYTVTYDGNGGTWSDGSTTNAVTVYSGSAYNAAENETLSNGVLTFMGWSTDGSTSVTYAAGTKITLSSNLTLYAVWSMGYFQDIINTSTDGSDYSLKAAIADLHTAGGTKLVKAASATTSPDKTWYGGLVQMWLDSDTIYYHSDYTIYLKGSCVGLFDGLSSLTEIDMSGFDTANVTNMSSMFNGCTNLATFDATCLTTTGVTTMANMFAGCSSLTTLDITAISTASATSIAGMFSGCSSLTTLDVSGFITTHILYMNSIFEGCSGITSIDLSGFNTSSVLNMAGMFSGCTGFTSLDVSNLDTSSVVNMSSMFAGCSGLTDLDLSTFDTTKVVNMSSMFSGCTTLATVYITSNYVSSSAYFDTSSVTSSTDMFAGCSAITGDLGTAYDGSYVDKTYAHLDGGSGDEGYFSSKLSTYTITYDGNSNTSGYVSNGYANERNSYSLTVADQGTLLRTDFAFLGWGTTSSDTTETYTAGSSSLSNISSDLILYAVWEAHHIFDGSNNYLPVDSQDNYYKLFETTQNFTVSFTIVSIDSSNDNQDTIVSCMDESGSPWPGFVLRLKNQSSYRKLQVIVNGGTENQEFRGETDEKYPLDNTDVSTLSNVPVIIQRVGNTITCTVNNNTVTYARDYDFQNFDAKLVFGSSLNKNGAGQRYCKCTLSKIRISIDS